MENIVITYTEIPKLNNPVLIEGLPGIGNVGKLAAEHLIEELDAKKFASLYSKYFPPQVNVNEDGIIKLVDNQLYYKRGEKNTPDIIILVGDFQGLTPEGQYELTDFVLKIAKELNVKRIFTLGGYGTTKTVKQPRVYGAATSRALVEEIKKYEVIFSHPDTSSGIVGASGLFLGLGKLYGMECICLMGETSGYFADPKSAEAVLKVLTKILNLEIGYEKLEKGVERVARMTEKLRELERQLFYPLERVSQTKKDEDLGYIG